MAIRYCLELSFHWYNLLAVGESDLLYATPYWIWEENNLFLTPKIWDFNELGKLSLNCVNIAILDSPDTELMDHNCVNSWIFFNERFKFPCPSSESRVVELPVTKITQLSHWIEFLDLWKWNRNSHYFLITSDCRSKEAVLVWKVKLKVYWLIAACPT